MSKELNFASAKNTSLRISPRKLGLIASLIRGLSVNDALIQLTFCKKRVTNEVKKCLQSAIANAENNNNLDVDLLYVSEVLVGKALTLKRFSARARGRGARITKCFSNLKITVKESVGR
jgi:large subunit ribosomal protein L22